MITKGLDIFELDYIEFNTTYDLPEKLLPCKPSVLIYARKLTIDYAWYGLTNRS